MRQNPEKKCPMFSSLPEKLAILPGIKELKPKMLNLNINSNIISIITIKKISDQIL